MKGYSVRFHTDYIKNFVDKCDEGKSLRGKFVSTGSLVLNAEGILIRGHYGKYSNTLLEQSSMLLGGIAGFVATIVISPVWEKSADSLLYIVTLFSIVVILSAAAVYAIAKFLLLKILYKYTLFTVFWDEVDSFCYAYPATEYRKPERKVPVLSISHSVDSDCNPVMLSSNDADNLVSEFRSRIPEKESNARARSFSVTSNARNRRSNDPQAALNEGTTIRHCPSCSMKVKVPISPPGPIGKCMHCNAIFKVHLAGTESLYLTKNYRDDNSNMQSNHQPVFKEYYDVIGVESNASPDDVKRAYRKRIREYHPDKVANLGEELKQLAEKKTRLINEAYNALKQQGRAE